MRPEDLVELVGQRVAVTVVLAAGGRRYPPETYTGTALAVGRRVGLWQSATDRPAYLVLDCRPRGRFAEIISVRSIVAVAIEPAAIRADSTDSNETGRRNGPDNDTCVGE